MAMPLSAVLLAALLLLATATATSATKTECAAETQPPAGAVALKLNEWTALEMEHQGHQLAYVRLDADQQQQRLAQLVLGFEVTTPGGSVDLTAKRNCAPTLDDHEARFLGATYAVLDQDPETDVMAVDACVVGGVTDAATAAAAPALLGGLWYANVSCGTTSSACGADACHARVRPVPSYLRLLTPANGATDAALLSDVLSAHRHVFVEHRHDPAVHGNSFVLRVEADLSADAVRQHPAMPLVSLELHTTPCAPHNSRAGLLHRRTSPSSTAALSGGGGGGSAAAADHGDGGGGGRRLIYEVGATTLEGDGVVSYYLRVALKWRPDSVVDALPITVSLTTGDAPSKCAGGCGSGGSSKHRCASGGVCLCEDGWGGAACGEATCSCAANEVCVAPNQCDCAPGFVLSDYGGCELLSDLAAAGRSHARSLLQLTGGLALFGLLGGLVLAVALRPKYFARKLGDLSGNRWLTEYGHRGARANATQGPLGFPTPIDSDLESKAP